MKKLFTLISVLALTLGASAQTQHMYEWKNGSITVRTVTEVDSLTFSLPADAVTFTTGNPSALTENSMTASYSLSTSLTINNSGATTEQGVCYSLEHEEPTIADSKVVYGTMYKGSWKSTLSQLRSGALYYYRPYLKIADAVFYGLVKSFTVLGDYVDTPEAPAGSSKVLNGDFELWDGSTPLYWKSASTASNATLSQSTDARGGQYAVCVQGNTAANKRLAYQEMKLAAGTYTMSFYAKAATDAVSSVRPGYVPMKADGSIDSSNYKFGSYTNDIPAEWTLITHEFTLASETTICLVIMNPKTTAAHTASDVLIDDFTLVKQ